MFKLFRQRPETLVGVLAAIGMLIGVACGAAEEATPTPTSRPPTATPIPATATPTTAIPPTATPTLRPGVTPVVATPTPTTAVPPTPTPTTGLQPKRGGILKESNNIDPNTFNVMDNASGGTNNHLQKLFSNLILNQRGDVLEPDAAESYKISGDGLTWTFVLRNNVKWQAGTPAGPRDGTLMTAKDVEYTLEKMMGLVDGFVSARCGWMKEFVDTSRPDKGVAVVDNRTLTVHMKQPFASFAYILATGFCGLIPDGTTRDMMNMRPYGSGPFVIKSFQRGSLWIYGRNPDYFKPGLPYLDETHQVLIRDTSVAQAAFITNKIDMTRVWPSPDNKPLFQKLADQGKIKWLVQDTMCRPQGLMMNATKPPFSNPKLREAVNLGMDRTGYISVVHNGYAEDFLLLPGDLGRTAQEISQMPGHRQPHDADFAEAKRIIKAEYPSGLEITIPVEDSSSYMKQGEYVSGELTKLGIKNTVKIMSSAELDAVSDALNYTAAPYWWCLATGTAEELFGSYFLTEGSRNWTGYSNPKVDAAYLDMAGTMDPVEKKRKAQAMEDVIMKDLPFAPLPVHTIAWNFYSYVQNYTLPKTNYNQHKYEHLWRSDI